MRQLVILFISVMAVFAQSEFRSVRTIEGDGALIRELPSPEGTHIYEYAIDPVVITQSNRLGYSSISLGDIPLASAAGKPILPMISQRFIVPTGMQIDSVSLLSKSSRVIELSSPLYVRHSERIR